MTISRRTLLKWLAACWVCSLPAKSSRPVTIEGCADEIDWQRLPKLMHKNNTYPETLCDGVVIPQGATLIGYSIDHSFVPGEIWHFRGRYIQG